MDMIAAKKCFEETFTPSDSALLTFKGTEGFDVYNCSIPFYWKGKRYIFGRVEKREEWARSWVRLFEESGKDEWTLVHNSMIYPLEDPYVSCIHNQLVMGGTHVRMRQGKLDTYYAYFYRGTDIHNMRYFTTGPDFMKDIRLVELADGRIGVFSRPRDERITEKYGSDAMVGFTIINSLDELNADLIAGAPYLEGLFESGQWGACNQAYLLESGKIGVIGHFAYSDTRDKENPQIVYFPISFVVDPLAAKIGGLKVIASRKCFPPGPIKQSNMLDVAFTSGIIIRKDGATELYSGLGDCMEGRLVIDYPFEGEGNIAAAAQKNASRFPLQSPEVSGG
ncbi:MAG: DUF1861 family protein [Treponema sp.]|jgi:hypothetical protein|nr:DUF1861 family protein [Treponema sp.]